jgi:cytochrome c oxidase assembly protein subunit 15
MLNRLRARTNGFTLTADQYSKVAFFALGSLTLIVFSGAAVRLTSSGLGCPDWPRCYGNPYPPLNAHSIIEFGNRVLSGLVTIGVFAAAIGAMRRRPYRRDLAVLAWLLPLGALAQAVLGALTVESELQYGWVMAHFGLSMVMMIAAVALAWRAKRRPGTRQLSTDKVAVWSVRALVPLTFCALLSGMAATAAGPHAGGKPGEVARFEPRGGDSLEWVVHRHGRVADILGIAAVAVWVILWRRRAPRNLRVAATVFAVLVGIQGLIGSIQWQTQLPAELVWLHVVFATVTWIAALWLCFSAGLLTGEKTAPATHGVRAPSERYEKNPVNAS